MELENIFDALMLAELEGETPTLNGRKVEVLPKTRFLKLGKLATYSCYLDPMGDGEGLLPELEPVAKQIRPKGSIAVVLDRETKQPLSRIAAIHSVEAEEGVRRYIFLDLKGREQTLEVRYGTE